MSGLSVSKGHYIKAIYKLTKDGNGTRITDIAAALCVSKASVCRAVKELEKAGLTVRRDGHLVYLSEEGKTAATAIVENYEALEAFFVKNLEMDKNLAIRQACALEHIMSSDDLHSIERLLIQSKL